MNGDPTEWLNKARDDLITVKLLGVFDEYPMVVACFHCQQAVEKSLKAFLAARDIPFLYRHDLGYLLDLCHDADPSLTTMSHPLSPWTSVSMPNPGISA